MSSTDPPLPPSPDEPTDETLWGGSGSADEHEPGEPEAVEGEGPGAGTDEGSDEEPTEVLPASGGEEPTEVLPASGGEESTEAIPPTGDEVTAVPPPTSGEDTEVVPVTGDELTELLPTGAEPTEMMATAAGGAAAADSTGEFTREHRRRVSHRRYVMRRIGVGLVALAIVGGGIGLLVALLGDDDDGAAGTDSTVPDTSEPVALPATSASSTTSGAPATTDAAATETTAAVATTEATPDPATKAGSLQTVSPNESTDPQSGGSSGTTATESSPPGTVVYDLESEASCEIAQTLRRGDTGPQVECLQERLNEVTVGGEPYAVDGAFGEQTESAVRAFQEASDLAVDGIVGPATGELLGIWAG